MLGSVQHALSDEELDRFARVVGAWRKGLEARGRRFDWDILLPSSVVEASRDIESDPHGKGPHEPGAKLDSGKPRLGLVLGDFARALAEVGKVGTYGAEKYSPRGWLEVPGGEVRYLDALYRHLLADARGEDLDPDSGLLHLAQVAWNCLAVLELRLRVRSMVSNPLSEHPG